MYNLFQTQHPYSGGHLYVFAILRSIPRNWTESTGLGKWRCGRANYYLRKSHLGKNWKRWKRSSLHKSGQKHESGNLNQFCDEQVHHYIDMSKRIIIEMNVMLTIWVGARQAETRSWRIAGSPGWSIVASALRQSGAYWIWGRYRRLVVTADQN